MAWENGASGDCSGERGVRRDVLLLYSIQGFPSEPENRDNHGKLCDDLIQNTSQRTGYGIVGNPEGRIDKHANQPDFLRVVGISCNS